MTAKARAVVRWLPALAWMAGIFVLSSQSDPPRPQNPTLALIFSTAAHFFVYGVLAVLLGWALPQERFPERSQQAGILAFLAAVAYGLTDEFHQSFVPHRDASLADWLTDAAGAASALWSLALLAPRLRGTIRRLKRTVPPSRLRISPD